MDLDSIVLIEISQAKKDKYCIIYMWNLKKKNITVIYTLDCQRDGVIGGEQQVREIKRYKL